MAKLIILSVKNLHYFWQSWLFIEDFIRELIVSREFTLYENEECRSHSGGTVVPDECYGAGGQGLPPLLHAGDVQGLWGEEEHQILNLLIYPIFYEELLTEL